MAGRPSVKQTSASPWRVAAGLLLGVEAFWWAGNIAISATTFIQSSAVELVAVIPVVLMLLTLLAIFLLIRAPRAGVWMGLLLQLLLLAEAVALAFTSSFVAIFFASGLAIITALCLAAAWPKRTPR